MRRYSLLLTVLFVLFVMTAALAGQNRPDMKLRVSTHWGARPVSLTIAGSIVGMKPEEFRACLLTVESDVTTLGGQKLISKDEMPCVEVEASAGPTTIVPENFIRKLTLPETGTYSYRIVLVRSDGKRLASTSQEVKVFRPDNEAGHIISIPSNQR